MAKYPITSGQTSFRSEDNRKVTISVTPYGYGNNLFTTASQEGSGASSIDKTFIQGETSVTYYVKGSGTLNVIFKEYVDGSNDKTLGAGELTGITLGRVASALTKETVYGTPIVLNEDSTQGTFSNMPIVPVGGSQTVIDGTPTVYIKASNLPLKYKFRDTSTDADVLSTKLEEDEATTRTITFMLELAPERTVVFNEWGYDGLVIGGGEATVV